MKASDLRKGQRVIVDNGEVRGKNEAVVIKLPPWTETWDGEEYEKTDQVMVKYPNTSLDGEGGLFGDMQEAIDLEDVVEIL